MDFLVSHRKCFFKFYSHAVKSFPQNLVGRINSVGGFALLSLSAALRAKISVITDFFAAARTINQTYFTTN